MAQDKRQTRFGQTRHLITPATVDISAMRTIVGACVDFDRYI
jgi:hypothetical protein